MNETNTKRKERIKTILIIFLALLLVLTFCSNTIMNYSLPIVAAQYAGSGTITEKIRGSGVVTANQNYEVVAEGTRVVESVSIKPGDEIKVGDALFVLEAGGDEEVKAAEAALQEAELAYQKALLTAVPDYAAQNQEIANAREDLQDAIAQRNAALQQTGGMTQLEYDIARQTVTRCTNKIAMLQEYQAALDSGNFSILPAGERETLESKAEKLEIAAAEAAEAQQAYDAAKAAMTTDPAAQEQTVASLERAAEEAELAYIRAKEDYEASGDDVTLRRAMEDAFLVWEYALEDVEAAELVLAQLREQETAVTQAETRLKGKLSAQRTAQEDYDGYLSTCRTSYAEQIADYTAEMQEASADVTAYENQQGSAVDIDALNEAVKLQERNLQSLLTALAQTKKNDAMAQEINNLDLQSQQNAIEQQKAALEEMKKNSGTLTVTSKHAGLVSMVNYAAGDTVMDGEILAVVTLTDSGYTMEFGVSAEQARMVKTGLEAEITNSYGNIEAQLISIKADTENVGSTDRILTFSVKGRDVTVGQMLSVSMICSSAMYDCVVPSSAVMEDNEGKFVMVVKAKSTPLGNRYITQRVNVTVLAADEINSAVQGELSYSDFVVTASEEPLESGMQIRMED